MRLIKVFLLVILFNGLLFSSDEKININFKNLKIMDLVKITSKIIDKNILITQQIKGNVDFISNKPVNKSELKDHLGAGIILTGGMTLIDGTRELAQALIPNIPIRIGKPANISNITEDLNSPEFSTVIGLLQYESGKHTEYELEGSKTMLHSKEYKHQESLQDITSFQNIDASNKPKISVSTPSFNDDKESSIDLFKDLSQEPKKNQNNPIDNFMDWAKKIF
jgi:cell division protein FtsA